MKLVKKNSDNYIWIMSKEVKVECDSLKQTLKFGIQHLDIPEDDLIYALLELDNKNHNLAEFGSFRGKFLFSDIVDLDDFV